MSNAAQLATAHLTSGSPTDDWLRRITDHIVENGLADASLRRLAQVAGTTHSHLRYYYGSRAGLLGSVLHGLRERESAQLIGGASSRRAALTNLWQYFTSPAHALEMQLFFEVAGAAVHNPLPHAAFVDAVVTTWIDPMARLGQGSGLPPGAAETDARIALASLRGLLLERLLTGDGPATDRAWSRFSELLTGSDTEAPG